MRHTQLKPSQAKPSQAKPSADVWGSGRGSATELVVMPAADYVDGHTAAVLPSPAAAARAAMKPMRLTAMAAFLQFVFTRMLAFTRTSTRTAAAGLFYMVLFLSSLRGMAVARVSCGSCGFHLLSALLCLAVPVACCSLVLCVCVLLVSELLEDSWLLAVACCACGVRTLFLRLWLVGHLDTIGVAMPVGQTVLLRVPQTWAGGCAAPGTQPLFRLYSIVATCGCTQYHGAQAPRAENTRGAYGARSRLHGASMQQSRAKMKKKRERYLREPPACPMSRPWSTAFRLPVSAPVDCLPGCARVRPGQLPVHVHFFFAFWHKDSH